MSILTAITLNYYMSYQVRARDTQRKSDLKSIQNALEQYKSANQVYAPDLNISNCDSGNSCVNITDTSGLGDNFYVVDFTGSGNSTCSSTSSSPCVSTDPFFDTIIDKDGTLYQNGYLSHYLERPKQTPAPSINSSTVTFYGYGSSYSLTTGEINYRAQNTYYLLRTVLENTNTNCTNTFADPGTWNSSNTNNTGWINATYPISDQLQCGHSADFYQITNNLF